MFTAAGRLSLCPRRRFKLSSHSKRTTEVAATETLANRASTNTTDQSAAMGKRTATAKRKIVPPAKGTKASTPTSRKGVEGQKLVCRYCGSHDLAPSFKKRRDARCRACSSSATVRRRESGRVRFLKNGRSPQSSLAKDYSDRAGATDGSGARFRRRESRLPLRRFRTPGRYRKILSNATEAAWG